MINNGAELQAMQYNGVEVQTWTHNGVEIYSAFKPFYWINNNVVTSGYPTDFTVTITTGPGYSEQGTSIASGFGVWSPWEDTASSATGVAKAVQTNGAKYMIMEYYYNGNGCMQGIYINGVLIPNTTSHYDSPKTKTVVVDVSGYENVVLKVNIMSAPWHNNLTMKFNKIYFTNEV